jgi:hypothetical protein
MMPYQSYQLWAAERTLTLSEQRAAARQRGEAAASISRSLGRLRRLRLHVQSPITPSADLAVPGILGYRPTRSSLRSGKRVDAT